MDNLGTWHEYLQRWAHDAERAGLAPSQVFILLALMAAQYAVRAEARFALEKNG